MLKNCGRGPRPIRLCVEKTRRLQTPGRVSPRLGGERLGPGWLASPRPAPSSPGRTASPPPSGSHVRSAGASMRQAVARPSVLSGCVLRLGRRRATRRPQPARFPWDGLPPGKTPPGYAAATARLRPRAGLDATAHRPQDTDAGQGLALSACGAGALAAARGPATVRFACRPDEAAPYYIFRHNARLRKRRPSSPKLEGRREASSSSPPVFGRGGALGAQAGGPRPRPGSRLGTAHLRTGGEKECTGTADTNPGCNYLVRGYSPSMHYFGRGDMPHFSSPLPFQQGTRGCRAAEVPRPPRMARRRPRPARVGQSRSLAAAVPRPPQPARSCTPSISAGMAPLAGAGQWTPLQMGGQPVAARAAQVRRGVTAAISIWPAAPAAGQPQQA